MEKLFYESAYIKDFTAVVVSCTRLEKSKKRAGEYAVILDQTAFYPEGGGQPADHGVLNDVHVLDVHDENGHVVHYTDGPLDAGAVVKGEIDWDRRYQHMQEHSGEHLLSGLIHERFGYDNVGFHMGSEEITIDINGPIKWEELLEIEDKANQIIYDDVEIRCEYPSKEELEKIDYRSKKELFGDIRIVTIPGGDCCACCGTHVRSTGEIGLVKFLSMINYKGGERITLLCGKRAIRDYEKRRAELQKISERLCAKPFESDAAVATLQKEIGELEMRIGALTRSISDDRIAHLPESEDHIVLFQPAFDIRQLRYLVNEAIRLKRGTVVAALAERENDFIYIMGSETEDMRALTKEMNPLMNGRGGGSREMTQGSCFMKHEELEKVFTEKGFKIV